MLEAMLDSHFASLVNLIEIVDTVVCNGGDLTEATARGVFAAGNNNVQATPAQSPPPV